ncbi:MAG: hypothetical protein M1381_11975 [Deltaproteobacteria bacterium]|nr:hypothetical protein [Deltaproteobacteria bacterium]
MSNNLNENLESTGKDLSQILQDIELGPIKTKIDAINKLRSTDVTLSIAQPVLDKVLLQAPNGSPLKLSVAGALAALGDNRDLIIDAIIPCMGVTPEDRIKFFDCVSPFAGILYDSWGVDEVLKMRIGLGPQLATIEALSHMRSNDRAASKLIDILDVLNESALRTFTLYACGANGNPLLRPKLEYYRDRYANSVDGEAARIALEHFSTATLNEISHFHSIQNPPKPKEASNKNQATNKSGNKCFIATAVYGDPNGPEVQVFRNFRDEVLLSSPIGRKFVSLYYQFSPYIASLIKRSTFIKLIVKTIILKPILLAINHEKEK